MPKRPPVPPSANRTALFAGVLPDESHYVQVSGKRKKDTEEIANYLRGCGMHVLDEAVQTGKTSDGFTIRWTLESEEDATLVFHLCSDVLGMSSRAPVP
jgi:hypothetical protein